MVGEEGYWASWLGGGWGGEGVFIHNLIAPFPGMMGLVRQELWWVFKGADPVCKKPFTSGSLVIRGLTGVPCMKSMTTQTLAGKHCGLPFSQSQVLYVLLLHRHQKGSGCWLWVHKNTIDKISVSKISDLIRSMRLLWVSGIDQ